MKNVWATLNDLYTSLMIEATRLSSIDLGINNLNAGLKRNYSPETLKKYDKLLKDRKKEKEEPLKPLIQSWVDGI